MTKESYYSERAKQWDTTLDVHVGASDLTYIRIFATVMRHLRPQPGETLLDVGCGEGQLLGLLWGADVRADGLDVSPRMLAQAQCHAPLANLHQGSFLDPFPGGAYDTLMSYSVLQYCRPADISVVMSRCAAALRPGGRMVHFAVPDLDRLALAETTYFRADSEAAFVRFRAELMAQAARGESPFADGTFFHSIPRLFAAAEALGLSCRLVPVSYRSHLVMTKAGGS